MPEILVWFLGWGDPLEKELGYPLPYSWASLMAQMVKNPPAMWDTWVQSLSWKDPLEEGMATHSSILAWRIPIGRGAWWATVHEAAESDTTEWLSTHTILIEQYYLFIAFGFLNYTTLKSIGPLIHWFFSKVVVLHYSHLVESVNAGELWMYGGLTISYAYFGLHGRSASFTLCFSRINCIYLIKLVIKFNNLENSHYFLFRGQLQMTFYFNGFCLHPNLFEEKNKWFKVKGIGPFQRELR